MKYINNEEDKKKLSIASDKIEEVVSTINERKRDDENMNKLYEIQLKFSGSEVHLSNKNSLVWSFRLRLWAQQGNSSGKESSKK